MEPLASDGRSHANIVWAHLWRLGSGTFTFGCSSPKAAAATAAAHGSHQAQVAVAGEPKFARVRELRAIRDAQVSSERLVARGREPSRETRFVYSLASGLLWRALVSRTSAPQHKTNLGAEKHRFLRRQDSNLSHK